MTIEESTAWALRAMESGDLQELERALRARRDAISRALASRRPPPPQVMAQIIEAGERLGVALEATRREATLDTARLRRIHNGFSRHHIPPHSISLRG